MSRSCLPVNVHVVKKQKEHFAQPPWYMPHESNLAYAITEGGNVSTETNEGIV